MECQRTSATIASIRYQIVLLFLLGVYFFIAINELLRSIPILDKYVKSIKIERIILIWIKLFVSIVRFKVVNENAYLGFKWYEAMVKKYLFKNDGVDFVILTEKQTSKYTILT